MHDDAAAHNREVHLEDGFRDNIAKRVLQAKIFQLICAAFTLAGVLLLFVLLARIIQQGAPHLSWDFLQRFPSRLPSRAGLRAALYGSIWIISMASIVALCVGVGAAIYLEEIAKQNRLGRFISLNIANLAGVPSIIYGILGLAVFVRLFGFGRSVLAGALTLAVMILPVIIISSREALRTVPQNIRLAAYALGATPWQTIYAHILPSALPGILTGLILAISRALGEAAPLILVGGMTYVAFVPQGPMDQYTSLPIQIYNWIGRPQPEFQDLAASGIIVLLILLAVANGLAIFLRSRFERRMRW